MKYFSLMIVAICFHNAQAQMDSTKFKNEIGVNVSPLVTTLGAGVTPKTTFELRYGLQLKEDWFWRSSIATGLPNYNYNNYGPENMTIYTKDDSSLFVDYKMDSERFVRIATGAEWRFVNRGRFHMGLASDVYYQYSEMNTEVQRTEYRLNKDVYDPIPIDFSKSDALPKAYLVRTSNELGLRLSAVFLYNVSTRFSVRADVTAAAGAGFSRNRDLETGTITYTNIVLFDFEPMLSNLYLQFHF
ncbi:MAG: hypothetical protein KDC83_05185 [Flavobacteriales bacterium]|nr:hypothetical protein [Flavobacteriales bacterium]